MTFYFSKTFNSFDLSNVEYWQCGECNFVMAKTLAEMSDNAWMQLNDKYHSKYQGTKNNLDDPRWLARIQEQAAIIEDINKLGLICRNLSWIDYGCGDGKLSLLLRDKASLQLMKYDRYMNISNDIQRDKLLDRRFDLVVNTSVFEHVRKRENLDEISSLVSNNGVLAIHTLVSEKVPDDPHWFYLIPVHCSLYTNKSMQILFNEWGFTCSIYHVASRLWFWFKSNPEHIAHVISAANQRNQSDIFMYHFKRGFMDYWK